MTELELLRNVKAAKDYDDRQAFGQLLLHFDPDLRRVAYGILRSQSAMDDALQIAYFKAYQSLATLHRPTSFGPWLRRIVVTTCLDHLRAQNRRNEVGLDTIPVSAPFDSFEAGVDIQHSLDRAMNKLSDHHRILIELIDGQAMSYKEVASILHKRPGTIASRTSRARKQLRKHLLEEGVEA